MKATNKYVKTFIKATKALSREHLVAKVGVADSNTVMVSQKGMTGMYVSAICEEGLLTCTPFFIEDGVPIPLYAGFFDTPENAVANIDGIFAGYAAIVEAQS